jgi:pullulanase
MSRSGYRLAGTVLVALSGWSCAGGTAPDAPPTVATIVVSPLISTLAIDAQLPLQAQVHDASGADVPGTNITWTVQDPRIVSVSADGVVTALAVGTSQIAANALGKSGIATITVTPGAVATVTVTAPSNRVNARSTLQLSATAKDKQGNTIANQTFLWSSSNTNTATVSAIGVVTGRRPGTVTITAQTALNGGKSGSISIVVN